MNNLIKIDFDKVLCDNFLGLNAVYHPFALNDALKEFGQTDKDFEKELELLKESNLKIARPFSNLDNDEEIPILEKWCRALKEIGVDVAIQPSWGMGKTFNKKFDEKTLCEYADKVFKNAWYLIKTCGLDNIKYLVLYTESTTCDDYPHPEDIPLWDYYVRLVKALHNRFTEGGLRGMIKFIGPNNSERGRRLDDAVKDLNDEIDIYSGHFYNYVHQWEWKSMCEDFSDIVRPTGKPFWLDEYGIQSELFRETPQYGTQLALIAAASVAAGHQTSLLWTLLDQKFPKNSADSIDSFHNGVHRWGLYHWIHDNIDEAGTPYPAWYAYCLLANALGGENISSVKSADRFTNWAAATKSVVHACAVKSGDDFTIAAINQNACPEKIRIETNKNDAKLYRYSFEPLSDDGSFGTRQPPVIIEMKNGVIEDKLPHSGFCIYRTSKIIYNS